VDCFTVAFALLCFFFFFFFFLLLQLSVFRSGAAAIKLDVPHSLRHVRVPFLACLAVSVRALPIYEGSARRLLGSKLLICQGKSSGLPCKRKPSRVDDCMRMRPISVISTRTTSPVIKSSAKPSNFLSDKLQNPQASQAGERAQKYFSLPKKTLPREREKKKAKQTSITESAQTRIRTNPSRIRGSTCTRVVLIRGTPSTARALCLGAARVRRGSWRRCPP